MIITTDFLTERENSINFHSERILKLLKVVLSEAGFPSEIFPDDFHYSKFLFDVNEFYIKSGINPSERYIRLIDESEISNDSIEYVGDFLNGKEIIIGYELTDLIKKIFSKLGKRYISIWLHPVRFLDDELFMIETNDSNIKKKLKEFDIDKSIYKINAEYIKIYIKNNFKQIELPSNSCVIFGQTGIDKTLRYSNGVYSLLNFKSEIANLVDSHSSVFFARHPYAKDDNDVLKMLDSLGINLISENSYRILCHENLVSVATISSSIGVEGYFFGKNVYYFNKTTCDIMDPNVSSLYLNKLVDKNLWLYLLNDKRYEECLAFNCTKNKARNILRAYYAYKIIER